MANEIIQGPVQLAGRGLTYKPNDTYIPGQFKTLDNLEVTRDGTLRGRRGFNFCMQTGATPTVIQGNFRKFIGNYGPWPVWTTVDDKLFIGHDSLTDNNTTREQTGFDWSDLLPSVEHTLVDAETRIAQFLQCEGFWHYNDRNFFLFLYWEKWQDDNISETTYEERKLFIYSQSHTFNSEDTQPLKSSTIAGSYVFIVQEQMTDIPVSTPIKWFNAWPTHYVKGHLLHKERAWVATSDTVYFSAATDPDVWAPPNGGFFKFPNQEIKDIIAIEDRVYVFCDSTIYSIYYTTDPNVDSQVDLISSSLGGDSVCAVGDTIFVLKDDSIHAINGSNVSKVMDLELDFRSGLQNTSNAGTSTALESFDGDLYLLVRRISQGSFVSTNKVENSRYMNYNPVVSILYRVDLELGSASSITMQDSIRAAQSLPIGDTSVTLLPIDMIFCTSESYENQPRMYVAFDYAKGEEEGNMFGYFDIAKSTGIYLFKDEALTEDYDTIANVSPSFDVQVSDYTPDGMYYFQKKFRSVLLTADVSEVLDFVEDEDYYPDFSITVTNEASAATNTYKLNRRSSSGNTGYRFPVNQRGRKISFSISRDAVQGAIADLDNGDGKFELSDLRVLWSHTGRIPEARTVNP